jgi:phage shock protein A
MGIFQKLSTMIKSNINDLISRAENPEKMLNQIILDMRDQLAKAKREVAAAIADERKLHKQLQDEIQQAREWEQRAMLAVREDRDDLARQALVRQQEHAQRVAMLQQTWQAQATETERLKGSLRQLNEKIDEAKRKRNLLVAKQKRAQAQRRIHETMSGLSDTSAFEAFNRMAEKIDEEERRNLAEAEVTQALEGDTLETEFLRLESGSGDAEVDGRLAALKQEMGLLAPADAPTRALAAGESPDDVAEAQPDANGSQPDAAIQGDGAADGASADHEAIPEAELLEQFRDLESKSGN